MRISLKQLLGIVAVAGVLCLVGSRYLQSRAGDFWGYGRFGLSDGTPQSPVYCIEVRGVGELPTTVYIVRLKEQPRMSRNSLDVAHTVSEQFDERTRVVDRWRSECLLLVGREVGEVIEIPLDNATARRWFYKRGKRSAPIEKFTNCEKFWGQFVSPRLGERGESSSAIHSLSANDTHSARADVTGRTVPRGAVDP